MLITIELEIDGKVVNTASVYETDLKIRLKMFSQLGISSQRPYAVFVRRSSQDKSPQRRRANLKAVAKRRLARTALQL